MAKDLGIILKETRIRLGMTIKDLSQEAGLSANTISYYEHGYNNPKIKTLEKVCKVMKLSLGDVINGIEYDYIQIRNPKDGCYTLINKTKGFILEQGKRKEPYPLVKVIEEKDLEV